MRKIVLAISFLSLNFAQAGNVVELDPGATLKVSAGQEVEVLCKSNSFNLPVCGVVKQPYSAGSNYGNYHVNTSVNGQTVNMFTVPYGSSTGEEAAALEIALAKVQALRSAGLCK